MTTYILYGTTLSLHDAKEYLENILKIKFEARESLYQAGEYFLAGDRNGESFQLKRNLDPFDGEPSNYYPPISNHYSGLTAQTDQLFLNLSQIKQTEKLHY